VGEGQGVIGSVREQELIDGVAVGANGWAACYLLVQTKEWELWSSNVGRGLATKLHPHLIALG